VLVEIDYRWDVYCQKLWIYRVMPDGCCISLKCTLKAEPLAVMEIKRLLHWKHSYFVEQMVKNEIKFSFFNTLCFIVEIQQFI
jgi:hypothetical protein